MIWRRALIALLFVTSLTVHAAHRPLSGPGRFTIDSKGSGFAILLRDG